jgi:hypothetical protein
MGTSNRSRGSSSATPLVPSFLASDPTGDTIAPPSGSPEPASPNQPPPPLPPLPPAAHIPERFRAARTGFTRFSRTRDEGTLRRALGNYVTRGTGGRHGALQRTGSSRATAAAMASFARTAQTEGTAAALRSIGLARCIGRPAGEVLPELLEAMCPDGGRIDEGIAREAFQSAIVDFAEQDLPAIEELTIEQWNVLLIDFLVRSIQLRVIADIGQRALDVPIDVARALEAEIVMRNVIYATVTREVSAALDRIGTVSEQRMQEVTDLAYERAWGAFEAFAEDEAP